MASSFHTSLRGWVIAALPVLGLACSSPALLDQTLDTLLQKPSATDSAPASQHKASKPNIIVILADDLGYGDVSCNNPESLILTPHIDRLASQGRRFTNHHTAASVCSPTRYSLMTGRYPWRSPMKEGVLYYYDPALIKKGRTTIASLLHEADDHTAGFGKSHIGLDWTPKAGDPGDWQRGQIVRYDPLRSDERVDLKKPLHNSLIDIVFDTFFGGVQQGNSKHYIQDDRVSQETVNQGEIDNVFTGKAEAFIREHHAEQKEKLFFVYLALAAVHNPYYPPANLQGKSKTGKLGDMILWVGQTVGRVTALLDELKIADDTLVLLTSDNGTIAYPNNAKLGHNPGGDRRGYKSDIWDGGTHVPFIARWPKHIPEGSTHPALICLTDLLATFASITGREIPKWNGEDGVNVLPYLTGERTNLWKENRGVLTRMSARLHQAMTQGFTREMKLDSASQQSLRNTPTALSHENSSLPVPITLVGPLALAACGGSGEYGPLTRNADSAPSPIRT